MKILVAGIPNSIHLARWISAALGSRHTFYVLPSVQYLPYHPKLLAAAKSSRGKVRLLRPLPVVPGEVGQRVLQNVLPNRWPQLWFRRVLRALKPDLVHAVELQHAGYTWLGLLPPSMPLCVTIYGSDLSLFSGFEHHTEMLRRLLARADFCTADCARDLKLARGLAFKGMTLGPVLNGSGVDLEAVRASRQDPPSSRRTIAIRGYAGWSGRAFVALDALLPIRELVSQFDVVVYSASEEVRLHAHVLRRDYGMKIETIAAYGPHERILQLLGGARTSLSISISDGASTALLESMAAGALPVHSTSACAEEFVADGVGALLVSAHEPATITAALRRALSDDAFVDAAAEVNWRASKEHLDQNVQRARIHSIYDEMEAAILQRRKRPEPLGQRIVVEEYRT